MHIYVPIYIHSRIYLRKSRISGKSGFYYIAKYAFPRIVGIVDISNKSNVEKASLA